MGVPPLGNWLGESNQIRQRCRILKDTYKMLSSWNQDAVIVLTKGNYSECINTLLDIRQSTKGRDCTKKKKIPLELTTTLKIKKKKNNQKSNP